MNKQTLIKVGRVGVVVVLLLWAFGWLIQQRMETYGETEIRGRSDESQAERLNRFRSSAADGVRSVCSNEVGFLRVVRISAQTYEANPNAWTATADVDVVTGVVGVARKTLNLQARQSLGEVWWSKVSEHVSAAP